MNTTITTRKLATIRKIDQIVPITGADAIECAKVDGWMVVVKKGEFEVGDLAIYCEIDSFIPHELAPFLSKGKEPREFNGVKGERLRTVKLRGQVSQGLLLPLFAPNFLVQKFASIENVANRPYPVWVENLTEEGWYIEERNIPNLVGIDVTEALGIQKWEPPVPAQLAGEVLGNFPSLVPKTDQERVQNLTREIQEWRDLEFEITEKLDGSSCTFFLDSESNLHVCSRNLDLKYKETNSFWRIAVKHDIQAKMQQAGLKNFAIQGELVGEGIQGNKYKLKGIDFFVFDMYNCNTGSYVDPITRQGISKDLGLNHVPVLEIKLDPNSFQVDILLELAVGKSVINKDTEREGIVLKCTKDPLVHFKAISNKFLLKNDE